MAEFLTKDESTIAEHRFKTTDGHHNLYVQEWGSKNGVPVLFVHGGPGSGCRDKQKEIFNPKKHRVVFIDQRGAGNSKPYGSLKENTTNNLVDDIELVREKLGISQWHITGTSWGSTLSLIYAINHPDRVKSLIIGGVWLCTEEEIKWLTEGRYRDFFPDAWERYKELNPDPHKIDYFAYSSAFIQMYRLDGRYYSLDKEKYDDTPLKIEFEYFKNKVYIPENYILDNVKKLKMPVNIVQGRYDLVTVPKFAYILYKKLPDSELFWTIAGHSASDRANFDTLKALLSQIK